MAVLLEDWRYRQLDRFTTKMTHLPLRDTEDLFRLYGKVSGHPTTRDGKYAYVSQPADFNEETRIVLTASGSEYKLGKCHGNEAEQFKLINRDVARYRKSNPPPRPFAEPQTAREVNDPGPARAPAEDNNTVISLDMDSDEDATFGRVFGHDEDDRDIDAIVAEALERKERLQREQDERDDLAEPARLAQRKVYDADQIEPA